MSPAIARCELTYLERRPIDYALAVRQHAAYEDALASLGFEIVRLPAAPEFPDGVFVEDTAVVLDEVAIIARPGVASRQEESRDAAPVLARYRRLEHIVAPGTLEGGDVLRAGRTLYVGRSRRTNNEGIAQLRDIAEPLGYRVVTVDVAGSQHRSLHLKTACSWLGNDTVLLDRAQLDPSIFAGLTTMISAGDPNVLLAGDTVLASPAVASQVTIAGFRAIAVDISEFGKAEAGLTCLSLIVHDHSGLI